MKTNLGRTECAILTNKSGGALAFGDVVIVDLVNASAFTTTSTSGDLSSRLGVVLDPFGIPDNSVGMIAFTGWVPRINLNASADIGDFVKAHSVDGQGTPHAAPVLSGDFAQVLDTGTNPPAILFGSTIQMSATGGSAFLSVSGLTGATQASRWVGATNSGAPVSGTFEAGDFVIDRSGNIHVCTVSGSPGTWSGPTGGGGGGLVWLGKQVASGSPALNFTSLITSTYDLYSFEFINLINATNAVRLYMRMSSDNGSNWDSGNNYGHAQFRWRAGASATSGSESGVAFIDLSGDTMSNAANFSYNGSLKLFNPLNSALYTVVEGQARYHNGSQRIGIVCHGAHQSLVAVDAVQFYMSSGNITSGEIHMYGHAKS